VTTSALLLAQLGIERKFFVSSPDADLRRKCEVQNELICRGSLESVTSSLARILFVCYVVTF
jgi:hypothetical protein